MAERRLIVFAKRPAMGAAKTRLARGLGAAAAIAWYRAALARAMRRLESPRWRLDLALAPDAAIAETWPAIASADRVFGQGPGDLGARMRRAFLRDPHGPAVIAGSDAPGLSARDIADGFAALRTADLVIAPSPDGGYALIGLRRGALASRLFRRVRWSSALALSDTLNEARGLRIVRLRMIADVDEADDLSGQPDVFRRCSSRRGMISTKLHGR